MDSTDRVSDRYRLIYDLHTHTIYSHGTGTVEDNVKAAFRKGLDYIAISDHGPGHLFYGIKRSEIADMRRDIEMMNRKYPKLNVRMSVEANVVKTRNGLDLTEEEIGKFDFIIAGYHYGLFRCHCIRNWLWGKGFRLGEKSLRKINTDMVIHTLRNSDISILTHPGDKGPFDIRAIAEVCAETDTLMEINTRHGHMTVEEIKIAAEVEGVKFVISSDAHSPRRVGDFESGVKRAEEAGLDLDRIVNIEKIEKE